MSSSQCSSTCTSDNNLCSTKYSTHDLHFSWTLEDFDFHEAKKFVVPKSSAFSATSNDKYDWYLSLKPNGRRRSTKKNTVAVYLNVKWGFFKRAVFAKCTIDFMEQDTVTVSVDSPVQQIIPYNNIHCANIAKKLIVFDNKITMRCHVTFSERIADATTLPCSFTSKTSDCQVLIESFTSLFVNQEFSDVTISVKGKDFPVHKCILAARSPVFAAMFKHDTKENQLNRVNIEDIDEKVMDAMLKYIYTGKCENFETLAEGLLAAADKYALDHLKIICCRKFIEILSVKNAASILLTAEMHHADELKAEIIKFIVAKSAEVFETDGWQSVLTVPSLVGQVFQAMAGAVQRSTFQSIMNDISLGG